ncbi:zinc-binding protein [Planctomycetales bacterium ZRK34]|nr:zinc-binding protein [Planctomycetales bacterium ZRK34]
MIQTREPNTLPVVFACAGRSDAAELTWKLARELDRRGLAEMSCLAGVGAGKAPFLRKIHNRRVWVIDGCPIECGLGIFALRDLPIDRHIRLHDLGLRKNHIDIEHVDLDALIDRIMQDIDNRMDQAVACGII